MTRARRILFVARRELAAYFASPIAYVVGVLFLAVQGFSFWAVVQVLSDPARKAPMGGVLRTYFGGTFLYWTFVFVLVATAAMRLIADDRRQGNWEALLTTPVEEGEAVVGKWLGALGYYLALWLPTLAFPLIVVAYAPQGSGPELAPIATAYLGVALSGAGFLALALAAGAATSNQVIAAVAGFVLLLAMLLVGQLPELAPSVGGGGVFEHIDLRRHMNAFARGDLELRVAAFYAGAIAVGLAAATALAGVGRRRRAVLLARLAAAGLVLVIAVLVNALVARHPAHLDVTAARVNSLEARTRRILAQVSEPVDAVLVRAGEPGFAEVYDEIERLLRRMAQRQPRLRVTVVDPVRQPEAIERLAVDAGVPEPVLRGVGAVVFRTAERVQTVELLDMADLGRDRLEAGAVLALRAEDVFATALEDAIDPDRPVVCASTEHGEMALSHADDGRDAAALAQRLERDGVRVESIARLAGGVPAPCRALLVLGPQRPLGAAAATAVDRFLRDGGRLLLAIDARPQGSGLVPHGLELVIVRFGLRTPDAIVVDPANSIELEHGWGVYEDYAVHAVTAGFEDRRLTVWTLPRAVVVEPPAVALASSSSTGWAETDIAALLGDAQVSADKRDLIGAIPVAAASKVDDARVVVLGAARPLASDYDARGVGANRQLAVSAVSWLLDRSRPLEFADKTPERVRLLMTVGQQRIVFALCVGVLPLMWVGIGGLVWWRRRRVG